MTVASDKQPTDFYQRQCHRDIDRNEIWNLPHDSTALPKIIYSVIESCRISAILMQPIMPDKMAQLLDMLGVDRAKRSWKHASVRADGSYGTPPSGVCFRAVLFPKILTSQQSLHEGLRRGGKED